MTIQKFIRLNGVTGRPEEALATDASSGAADAGKIVALNADGKLDPSLFPFQASSWCCWICRWLCRKSGNPTEAEPPPELKTLIS